MRGRMTRAKCDVFDTSRSACVEVNSALGVALETSCKIIAMPLVTISEGDKSLDIFRLKYLYEVLKFRSTLPSCTLAVVVRNSFITI